MDAKDSRFYREPAPVLAQHPDDAAVDCFAQKMKDKLSQTRAMGRSGWPNMAPEELSQQLRKHVTKGDPVDVANYCMFLSDQGAGITPASQRQRPVGLR